MVAEYPELIASLEDRTQGRKVGRAMKSVYKVWGIPELEITRWKFNEWDYYSDKAKLPISARGLFTLGNRILVRGYNKFFNIGEVKATNLDNLKTQTAGPFYATVKENGFLVLIGAYDGKLVVTSKNSSGPESTNSVGRNYSETAREWVLKHLASAGKSEAEFARLLEQNDWTAVGEVCDDDFEEHVLPYPPSLAGVYLNGLNHNTQEFATESPAKVLEVCEEFGFRRTEFVEFPTFESLMAFLEGGQKTGKWADREVEGFVIRCRRRRDPQDESSELIDFFWKFKFEEPYLMYREWREVVRSYLESGPAAAYMRAKRSRHSESCFEFLKFARVWLEEHPSLKDRLLKYNLGIIELRTEFFNKHEISEDALLKLDLNTPRWLLVTVATIGCGKSTVCNALTHLMQGKWAHTQNDALPSRGGKFAMLTKQLSSQLTSCDVAILDKNNSGKDERQKIVTAFDEYSVAMGFDLKYVCLNFLPKGPTGAIRKMTRERVFSRGDSHLTIQVSQLTQKGVSNIMSQFENRFDIVNRRAEPDSQFDLIIDLVPGESVQNVKRILQSLSKTYPKMELPAFTDAQIADAVSYVREHEQELAEASRIGPAAQPSVKVKYFGVGIDASNYQRLAALAQNIMAEKDAAALENMVVQDEFHITMAHYRSHKPLLNKLKQQYKDQLKPLGKSMLGVKYDVVVEGLYWNRQIAAFKVIVNDCANKFPHITVGASQGTPAFYASTLFDGTAQNVNHVDFEPISIAGQELYAS